MSARRAVIVGGVDYGEADRVVHVLTAEGRATWFAPAAKRSRKRFGGALEPFTTVDATLEARRRQGLSVIASLAIIKSRAGLSADLGRSALASYLTELSGKVAPEGDDARDIVALLERALDRLDVGVASRAAWRAYELLLAGPLGYRPDLSACAVCGRPAGEGTEGFDAQRGGVLCADHGAGAAALGPKTRAWAGAVLERGADALDDPTVGFDAAWADTAALKLGRGLDALYRGVLDGPLRSRAFLDEVLRSAGSA